MFGTDGVARSTSSESLPSDAIKPASQPYTTDSSIKSLVPTVVLFIQMEYCEKSTLRNCIDEGLYRNPERVWRLFREIVEGLGHIHQQVRSQLRFDTWVSSLTMFVGLGHNPSRFKAGKYIYRQRGPRANWGFWLGYAYTH